MDAEASSTGPAPMSDVNPNTPGVDQQSGARLMIEKMVLRNFKSYAGEQVVGPFHKCFSSVVGKSNHLESTDVWN